LKRFNVAQVPKKAKKILSPAEAMLQRVEILKQEENERQLNAAIAGYEAVSHCEGSHFSLERCYT